MKNSQKGISLIGFAFTAIIVGFIILTLMRIGPIYYQNFKLARHLNLIAKEYTGKQTRMGMSLAPTIRDSLQKRFEIDGMRTFSATNLTVSPTRNGTKLTFDYQVKKHYIFNIDLLVKFSEEAVIPNNG